MADQPPAPLLAFKAGRAFRREGTNMVDHSPEKGAIYLYKEEGLLHFQWKSRPDDTVEEDLILFPEDAAFIKVDGAAGGRSYVLKFSSSNQRHFFWMQDASDSRDEEFAKNLNGYLQNIDYEPVWESAVASSSQNQVTPGPSQNTTSSAPRSTNYQPTAEDLAQLRSLVSSMADSTRSSTRPDMSLSDILTVENMSSLLSNQPGIASILLPHLPSDLPVPVSPKALQDIVASPQFQSAVRNFDYALQTGLLGNLVQSLGLPEEAGLGVEPFLRAIDDQARTQENDSREDTEDSNMDTD